MSQPQTGWYPDPADPTRQRYWAGDSWTVETRSTPADAPPSEAAPAIPPPGTPQPDPYATYTQAVPVYVGPVGAIQLPGPTTADGVSLANYGFRLLSWLLDGLIFGIPEAVVLFLTPHLVDNFTIFYRNLIQQVRDNPGGTVNVNLWDPAYGIVGPMATYLLIVSVIQLLYAALMLGTVGATLGQMACGLKVVPVDQGQHKGGLRGYNLVMRLLFFTLIPSCVLVLGWALAAGGVVINGQNLGSLGTFYLFLSTLWVAWDVKRQALHDKVAKTQVVRVR